MISVWAGASIGASGRQVIDPDRSSVSVHVGKSGIFRAFADDHEIRGTVKQGFVDEDARTVEVLIDARGLRVLDPKLSEKDRADVQMRMLGSDVLDVERYPEIRFVSNGAEKTPQGWRLQGQLTLHGRTESVMVSVTGSGNHFTGSAHVKQTDFGMTPVTVAGGAVKVKDEVTIDVDIVTRPPGAAER